MSSEIHLLRYNEDFTQKKEISELEWQKYVDNNSRVNFKFEPNKTITTFCKELNEEIPIFWIDKKGLGSMRFQGFFKFEESYNEAIEIAKNLNCIICGDEGEIYYLNKYGVIFDPTSDEEEVIIVIDDLRENKIKVNVNFKEQIDNLLKLKEQQQIEYESKKEEDSFGVPKFKQQRRKWWEFWK